MIKEILRDKLFLFFCLVFIVIALSYPLTFTFDSGHYMFLADVINNHNWPEWDPIRGIVFPLFLSLFTNILGRNQNALLIPMTFAQVILFLFATFFVLHDTKITKPFQRKIIIMVVFLFIMLDPLIMGYYHTVLTEFFAATIGILSCYFAYRLYQISETLPTISKHTIFPYVYFLLVIPFAWHLKQPYVGTALFPFLLSSLLILIRRFNRRVLQYVIFANILVLVSLGISITSWSAFLRSAGMPEKPTRELTGFINAAYDTKAGMVLESPTSTIKYVVKNYLALSNIFFYDQKNDSIVENNVVVADVSFTRSGESGVIAYRAYNFYGQLDANIFPMPDLLKSHVDVFYANYLPALWFNETQKVQIVKSNFMFSVLYLFTPLMFVYSALTLIKNNTMGNIFVFICSGSALMNIVAHSLFVIWPLDRYVFWGYPLNIIAFIVLFIELLYKASLLRNTFVPITTKLQTIK
ncbi:MAG: hypothetical protein HZB19_03940 [Chloroflexi bacterium]|nr:hypothetical protein [Chloroflexota bacterium]